MRHLHSPTLRLYERAVLSHSSQTLIISADQILNVQQQVYLSLYVELMFLLFGVHLNLTKSHKIKLIPDNVYDFIS